MTKWKKNSLVCLFSISPVTSHLESILIRTATYIEKQCRSSSDSDADSTVISNTDGSRNVETDQWDFEETGGDKISDGNVFRGNCGAKSF